MKGARELEVVVKVRVAVLKAGRMKRNANMLRNVHGAGKVSVIVIAC